MRERIIFLDYLRVIACFMVILVHSCEFFYIADDDICIRNMTDGFWVCVIDSAFRCSVPLFVMISAFLLVPIKGSTEQFLKRRLVRVVIPFIVWSILYATLPYIWGDMSKSDVYAALQQLIFNFNGAGGHMWFIYMLIGIYLFMPVISPWLEKAGKRAEIAFLLLWFLSSCFPYLRDLVGDVYGECHWNEFNVLWYFSGFIGYVVLAHYLREHLAWSKNKQMLAGICLYAVGYYFTSTIWHNRISEATTLQQLELSWRFCTPNVIAMSMGAFLTIRALFANRQCDNRIVKAISTLSYGVYLMHIFILGAIYNMIEGVFSTPITIALIGTITFVTCCILAKLISKIPYSQYVIG